MMKGTIWMALWAALTIALAGCGDASRLPNPGSDEGVARFSALAGTTYEASGWRLLDHGDGRFSIALYRAEFSWTVEGERFATEAKVSDWWTGSPVFSESFLLEAVSASTAGALVPDGDGSAAWLVELLDGRMRFRRERWRASGGPWTSETWRFDHLYLEE